jgi:asparagine synthase (glutamine-hydrolysing)
MCGIAGILHRDGRPASITTLTAMTDIIAHRGPDGEGHYCNGPVGLGHRRFGDPIRLRTSVAWLRGA